MVDAALGQNRIIGMIQPKSHGSHDLYDVGCAGRIASFSETDDGRYLITLSGLCRFKIASEQTANTPYRTVRADWQAYKTDMAPSPENIDIDRACLNRFLDAYFRQQDMSCDWNKVDITPTAELLTALAMICPLKPSEKQALLECADIHGRTKLFMTMIEMAANTKRCSETDDNCCH